MKFGIRGLDVMLLSVFECRGRICARKGAPPEALRGLKIKNSFAKSICDFTQYMYAFVEIV